MPGLVRSKTDGQAHYINANQLAMLYRIPMAECIVMPPQTPANHRQRMGLLDRVRSGELVGLLTPQIDGDYQLPDSPERSDQP
jgi:hypothetical protein